MVWTVLHRVCLASILPLATLFALGASAHAGGRTAAFDGRWVAVVENVSYQRFPFAAVDIAFCADGGGWCGRLVQENGDCGPVMLSSDGIVPHIDDRTSVNAVASFDDDEFQLKLSLSNDSNTLMIRGVRSIEALVRRSPSMVTRFRRDDAARCEPVQS